MPLLKIKKITIILLAILAVALMFSACATTEEETTSPADGDIYAYITDYDKSDGTITIDEVEWITTEDTDRIEELDLDVNTDFTNDYYIYNTDKDDLQTINLADDVVVVTNDNNMTDTAGNIADDQDNNGNNDDNGVVNDTDTTNDTTNPTNNDTVNDAVDNATDAGNDLLASITDMIGVNQTPFKITIKDDKVTRIEEAYMTTTKNTTTNNE